MDSIVAVSMCKDEIDVIEVTLRHMATQVDFLVVADNNSTDGTRDLLSDLTYDLPLTVLDDPEVGFMQSRKMTDLAKVARNNHDAEWIIAFDADEFWYSPFGTIKDVLNEVGPQWLTATAALYDHVSSSEDNLEALNPVKRIGWRRREKGALPKVACRWREDLTIEQGNHSATYDGGTTYIDGLLVIRHFPYRSPDQFTKKVSNGAAAYAATDLGEDIGAHWRGYGAILAASGEEVLKNEVYKKWFYLENPYEDPTVIYDPAPINI